MTHERTGVWRTFRWPAEHGAWGILLVPFLCASAVAGRWNMSLALCGVCALALFLLRGSLSNIPASRTTGEKQRSVIERMIEPVHLALAICAAASAATLVFYFGRRELIGVAVVGAALYGLQTWMVADHREHGKEKRSLLAELVGVAFLTLTAPAAWIAARGSFFERSAGETLGGAAGLQVWLLNLIFYLGGILYVKYRVRGLFAHREFHGLRERLVFAWPVFVYHLCVVLFLLYWLGPGLPFSGNPLAPRGWALGLAFAPALVRAGGLSFALGRRFPIRRLGWTEVLYAAVFAVFVVAAFRLGT
jgi:hypothetical protein